VVIGNAELVAATLGTFPSVGVGLLVIIPESVAIDEVELDLVGLGGCRSATGDGEGANPDEGCLINAGAVAVVGVGVGVGVAEPVADAVKPG